MMKNFAVLLSAICLIFSISRAYAEPKIETSKKALYIQSEENAYVYFFKEKRANFIIVPTETDTPVISITTLDREDTPRHITAMMMYEGALLRQEFLRSDKENTKLYEDVRSLVKNFVEENEVKKIIAKYTKRKR